MGKKAMEKEALLSLIDEFKDALLLQATDGVVSETDYKRMRDAILSVPGILDKVPDFIKKNRKPMDFFRYMQKQDEHYKGRRELIYEEMNNLASFVEFNDYSVSGLYEYTRGDCLGRGGFGEVYKYHHPLVDLDFAVKIYDPVFASDEKKTEGEKRFLREAQMLFKLNHPNIVRIYDVGRINGKLFIKMELINGRTLYDFQQKYSLLPFYNAANIVLRVLSGLQCAHVNGIIHRDLKPSNIMVYYENGNWNCKIIDFGISAFMDTEGYTKLTRSGERIAGGQFIDPMLMKNPKSRDPRSDIYSVGAILFFLLSGRPPVFGSEAYLQNNNSGITPNQIAVVMKALELDPDKRYSSCDEMSWAIQQVL